MSWWRYTQVGGNYTQDNYIQNQPQTLLEDNDPLYSPIKIARNKETCHDNDENKKTLGDNKEPSIPSQFTPHENRGDMCYNIPLPLEHNQCPQRVWKNVVWPGNAYGKNRNPIDIEKDVHQTKK